MLRMADEISKMASEKGQSGAQIMGAIGKNM